MFQVVRSKNRLVRLEERRFSDLKLREREHLQEWLAYTPEALGEEMLVIQKEFDGFVDTRERLDLLALDKEGRLVVIENKLDDSGRDVPAAATVNPSSVSARIDQLGRREHLAAAGWGVSRCANTPSPAMRKAPGRGALSSHQRICFRTSLRLSWSTTRTKMSRSAPPVRSTWLSA